MSEIWWTCSSCGADWSEGRFTADCKECGGGAMERPCVVCEGRCGQAWKRAVIDSHDFREAHWIGRCALPEEEQAALLRARLEGEKRNV